MMKIRALAPLLAVLVLAACEDDLMIENFNTGDVGSLIDNPTRTTVGAAATGLLISARDEYDDVNGYVSLLGILGRESYRFDAADPRFVTEMLTLPFDPGSRAFGGNIWPERYGNIKTAVIIVAAVDQLPEGEMTDEEKEATRGFAKTIMAHEFLLVINTRDTNGAVIDVSADISITDPAPLVGKSQVFAHIEMLLDEAADDLDAAGDAFPFALTSGFSGFETPAEFRKFNRGLAARVDVYTEDHLEAIANLTESFVDVGAPLDLGVYLSFGTGTGDETNDLFTPGNTPNQLAHPSLVADAETRMNGEPDLRVQTKIRQVAPQTVQGITTDVAFDIYDSPTAPMPLIRNEELILLRAEANIFAGSMAQAISDINLIRQTSGGLAARTDLDATNIMDELVFQRRYSLVYEGGHRWIDARRLDRFAELPLDLPNHIINERFPIPEEECLARGLATCSASGP